MKRFTKVVRRQAEKKERTRGLMRVKDRHQEEGGRRGVYHFGEEEGERGELG